MQQGYILLYRAVMDQGWANKPDYMAVWVYLLMRVNFKEREVMLDGKTLLLNPGQFVTSRKRVASDTGVHESKIQRILSLFESEHQIEQQKKSKYRVITITNWSRYQHSEHQNEQQMNSKRTADEQQMNTDKECKKEKKEKKKHIEIPSWIPSEEWDAFVEMRKVVKKPLTEHGKKLAIGKLEKLKEKGHDPADVLNQSVMNNWKGLFEIKEKGDQYGKQTGKRKDFYPVGESDFAAGF